MTKSLNSERYLQAFNSIEKHLRKKTQIDRRDSFYQLVEIASNMMPEVRRYKNDLKEYGDLRNAIIHERTDSHVIAEPNIKAVESIEIIKNIIQKPPKVIPLFQCSVLYFDVNDSIGTVLKKMTKEAFSQIPIVSNGKFKALLTNNTISRWLGSNVDEDIFSLQETKIGEVLKFTEDRENYLFIVKNTTLFEVIERFSNFELVTKKLEALLITHSGKQHEKIIGIITVSDLPKLLDKISQQINSKII